MQISPQLAIIMHDSCIKWAIRRMISVDAFDLKMLAALQDDGRLTNQQLADLVGLSASQCSRRRMRLEEEKVIAGYHADLAGEALGFNLIAFIHITLATHSPDNAKKFRALVNRVDEIQEAYSLTGDADYLLKVGAARPQEPVRHRQQRADAAPERGACALVDRARPAEGEREAAAEGAGLSMAQIEGNSPFAFASICDDRCNPNHERRPWRCNFDRTANIATRTCRRTRRRRASAPTNARSVRTASRPSSHNVCPNCGGGFVPRPIRPAEGMAARASASRSSRRRTSACI